MDSFTALFLTEESSVDSTFLTELGIEFKIDSTPDVLLDEDSAYRPPTWCTIA